MSKLGIIILNWNNYIDTKICIESVLLIKINEILSIDIFVIDNNSQDGSGDKLEKEFFHKVNYYDTGSNGGYTGGNNFGIQRALDSNCDYILVLNNDLEIDNISSMLDSVVKVFKSDDKIGIIGFDIFDYETRKQLKTDSYSNRIFNKLLDIDTSKKYLQNGLSFSNERSVCGCAICFHKDCIREIGLFDENFFMYAEEHDICLRAIKNSWSVIKINDKFSKIYRKIDPISEKQLIWYYGTRNIFYAYKKNLSKINKYFFSFIQVSIYMKQIISFILDSKSNIASQIWSGLVDGYKNNYERK